MRKINSFQEYKEITKLAKEQGFIVSNCFFLQNVIQEKIEKNKLFVVELDSCLLLLEDEKDFFRCYYYFPLEVIPAPIKLEKNAVIEFPYQERLTTIQEKQINQINGMGFTLGRRSGLMTLAAKNVKSMVLGASENMITFANQNDKEAILSLLSICFNPLYSFIPDLDKISWDISENKIWVIKKDGKLVSVLISKVEKNIAIISQVAVAPEFRGRGYGKMLVDFYHNAYKNQVRNFQHWVDLSNTAALCMYSTFGYQFSSRKANEYILLKYN